MDIIHPASAANVKWENILTARTINSTKKGKNLFTERINNNCKKRSNNELIMECARLGKNGLGFNMFHTRFLSSTLSDSKTKGDMLFNVLDFEAVNIKGFSKAVLLFQPRQN